MSRTSVVSDVFCAIAEPRRRQIIDLLSRRGALAVGTIALTLGLPQPAVSKHLGVLREVGVVRVSQQGQSRMYAVNHDQLRPVYDWAKSFEPFWNRQLDRIRARAERQASSKSTTAQSTTAQPTTAGQATRKKGNP